jgi:hypothetical protein
VRCRSHRRRAEALAYFERRAGVEWQAGDSHIDILGGLDMRQARKGTHAGEAGDASESAGW